MDLTYESLIALGTAVFLLLIFIVIILAILYFIIQWISKRTE
ncbi:hypothetical protein [Methanolapillus ohkumae]|uniref:Uncharacterized protein n=1 Tax=Methanolapillus ohkumae TaxID=3028298 RepID=A0AA96V6G7_9EURY|nr:hypothetical protein MsAm2_14150 [Methanosarcinaceae archaeon Am2]